MPQSKKPENRNLEVFARALENVLRKLIRFLVGKISLRKLSEMIKAIYIQEAERKLKTDNPNKNVSLTKLAVLTGIDTRTLTKARNDLRYSKPLYQTKSFLKELTPESNILDIWSSDPRYLDTKTGRPNPLKLNSKNNGFDQLVRDAVGARGITAKSLLAKLLTNCSVRLDEERNEVILLDPINNAFSSGSEFKILEIGLIAISNLIGTVFNNFSNVKSKSNPFFQREIWTHRLNPENRAEFEQSMRKVLDCSTNEARKKITEFEENYTSNDQLTAGVSFYYFEDRPE